MLNAMRSNRKFLSIVLWLVILAFLSTIFVVWGLGPNENQGSFAIKVGKDTISYDEYKSYYDNTIQSYRNALGDGYDEFAKANDIDKLIIDELINRKLLINEAKRLGVIATDTEIIATVRIIPAFQENGKFDSNLYQEVLRYNRQTPAKFEDGIRSDLLLQKVNSIIRASAIAVNDTEITNEYNARNIKKAVNYIAIPLSKFSPDNVTETQIETYFNSNKDNYKTSAEIKLKYIVLEKSDFKPEEIVVPDADVERYYAENIAKYSTPESINASHIIAQVADWNNTDLVTKAKTKIDAALAEVSKPKSDFASVAKKYSEDGAAANGGSLGSVTKGMMVPEFEEAAFKLNNGEISGIVKSQFGFHIIKINSKQAETTIPIQDVKSAIVAQIRDNNKISAYRNQMLALYRNIVKSGNITAYLAQNADAKFDVKETGFFKENDKILPIFNTIPSLEKSLFNIGKTDVSQLIEDNDKTYLFEVADKLPSVVPDIKTIYAKVKSDYIKYMEGESASKELNAMLNDNKSLDEIGAKYAVAIETANMTRNTQNILSSDMLLYDKIFRTKDNTLIKSVYLIDNEAVIAAVEKSTLPDATGLAAEKDGIKSYISTVKSDEAIKSYVDNLKSKQKIIINEALMPVK